MAHQDELDTSFIKNPDVAHEETDVSIRPIVWFMVWLTVASAVVMLLMKGMYVYLDTRVGSACPRSTSGNDSSRCASSATVRSASSRSPRSIRKNVPLSWIETIASRPTACFM